jgi:hypothetical protein
MLKTRELLGVFVGVVLAPFLALFSRRKRARVLHSEGIVVRAEVSPLLSEHEPVALQAFGRSLAGPATVRFSQGVTRRWDGQGSPAANILGLGLALGSGSDRRHLLLATFERFGTFGRDRRVTVATDFLADVYQSVGAFALDGLGIVQFRVRSFDPPPLPRGDLASRLAADIRSGRAQLTLEVARPAGAWRPIARLELLSIEDRADPALSPHHTGPGLRAVGFLAGLRRVVYPVAQWARRPPAATA